jgi:hypothetical protein
MKYGHKKQINILQYTAAAAPCEVNEGEHQQTKMWKIIHTMLSWQPRARTIIFRIETCRPHLVASIIEQQNT